MRIGRLEKALRALDGAMREVSAALEEMQAERDPLATLIFLSRRSYRSTEDTKGGRRHTMLARLSYEKACNLGFQGSLSDWQRLLGGAASRG